MDQGHPFVHLFLLRKFNWLSSILINQTAIKVPSLGKGAQCSEIVKSRVSTIWFIWKNYDLLVAQEKKFALILSIVFFRFSGGSVHERRSRERDTRHEVSRLQSRVWSFAFCSTDLEKRETARSLFCQTLYLSSRAFLSVSTHCFPTAWIMCLDC